MSDIVFFQNDLGEVLSGKRVIAEINDYFGDMPASGHVCVNENWFTKSFVKSKLIDLIIAKQSISVSLGYYEGRFKYQTRVQYFYIASKTPSSSSSSSSSSLSGEKPTGA
ncbi:hypothetical protein H4219_005300 [Mycoemilia scoparia]|uniref:Uncharacterized protein n=1 Tax=Mycoemilia scoparia TaxID=417184 RepID=A0A9W7ZV65_9FUNG|nr:hypothetical protein H4219_005300 [Mycoemilia scoparia]